MLRRRTAMAPGRRFRGKRRYFRNIERNSRLEHILPGTDGFWANWHWHADWRGWGNDKWRYRREGIRALCTVYESILQRADGFDTPFQAWIALDGEDAGSDAVFLYTPNPHHPFPYTRQIEWGPSPLEPLFSQLLPTRKLRFGTQGDRPHHIVWAESGVPLDEGDSPPT